MPEQPPARKRLRATGRRGRKGEVAITFRVRPLLSLSALLAAAAITTTGEAAREPGGTIVASAVSASRVPIQAARRARREFSIFPHERGTILCRIPRGSPGPTGIPGTCSTSFSETPGHGGDWIIVFTERWAAGATRSHHAWRVRVTATSRIRWIRQSGSEAPQSWK